MEKQNVVDRSFFFTSQDKNPFYVLLSWGSDSYVRTDGDDGDGSGSQVAPARVARPCGPPQARKFCQYTHYVCICNAHFQRRNVRHEMRCHINTHTHSKVNAMHNTRLNASCCHLVTCDLRC